MAAEHRYDAFLSYSSHDVRLVRRVQRFLESYRSKTPEGPRRRLRVFLDRTDIRGGPLKTEIQAALKQSRVLIACGSKTAADSEWVRREIAEFQTDQESPQIAALLLSGDPKAVFATLLGNLESRYHDLRGIWRWRLPSPRATGELLRLLAFLTNADMQKLRNWRRRRALFNLAVIAALCALPTVGVLSYPMQKWEPVAMKDERQRPIYAISCEVDEGKYWVASRFQAPGPQGPRNYIQVDSDALGPKPKSEYPERFKLRRRLLPISRASWDLEARTAASIAKTPAARLWAPRASPGGKETKTTWVGEPLPGLIIIVGSGYLAPAEEDAEAAEEASDAAAATVAPVGRSFVIVDDGSSTHYAEVRRLDPRWKDRTDGGDPTSPANGLPVACASRDSLWLGMPARPDHVDGGLWHSADAGASWSRAEGFSSVCSILTGKEAARSVFVAESHHQRWVGGILLPNPPRVVCLTPQGWVPTDVPSYGTRSEIELCGMAPSGDLIVRVDEIVSRASQTSLAGFLLKR